jgi:diketogulonate reductase-like aldo/keto reductase
VDASVSTHLQLGGTRIDNSASYHNQLQVGTAMHASGLPRASLFLTSKVGQYLPMGYAEAMQQFNTSLSVMKLDYIDLLLIHWPTCVTEGCENTTEPACNYKAATYNATTCRLQTWRALVDIFKAGGARAIGVSNYNETHLQEIADAGGGLPLPAVNQCPFNLWHSRDAAPGALLDFCKARGITYNGYSPFAVPDRRVYPPPFPRTLLQDAALVAIAAAHGRQPAEVALAWQWQLGIVVNPRSQNARHQWENLNFVDIRLTDAEMQTLGARPQY